MMVGRYRDAVEKWRSHLGPAGIITDLGILRDAETATFPTSHTVPVILSPADAGQVQECVRKLRSYGDFVHGKLPIRFAAQRMPRLTLVMAS